jgi:FkbM family methyltransferase
MDGDIINEMQRDIYHVAGYVRDGDFVLDVGAYIGAFALHVKRMCPGARVLCLEPMPENFAALRANVKDKAKIEQIALVGNTGPITIYDFGADASACHSIYDLGVPGAMAVKVPGETLQDLMGRVEIDRIRFLKLDCQGAEFEIIAQTTHEVLARIDYIGMEVHRAIAKTGAVLGAIPDHERKVRRLYRHLTKTHFPIHGDIENDSIQVWANRKLIPWRTQIRIGFSQEISNYPAFAAPRVRFPKVKWGLSASRNI